MSRQCLFACCLGRDKLEVPEQATLVDKHRWNEKVSCEFCRRRFKNDKDLQSHIRVKHMEEPGALQAVTAAKGALGTTLQIALQDDWLAVVVKPQGCPTFGKGSLAKADWLLGQLKASSATDALRQPRPAHRLDAGTGGLIVLAKTKGALRTLCEEFANGCVRKRYRALVWGRLELGQEGECTDALYGKPSLTRYRAAEPPVETPEGFVSTLDLWPLSGRRHQLRRHLAMLGCPILGDRRYGGRAGGSKGAEQGGPQEGAEEEADEEAEEAEEEGGPPKMPLFLWALQLSLPHPFGWDPSTQGRDQQVQQATGVASSAETAAVLAEIPEPELFSAFRKDLMWSADKS
eukprot:TRINITY_DN16250_c0_g1_i4.p1 TRINITY_DN16250_c0_g1~~TRINITY_DN16250_c0_g1_i4.p1  ORF type:complete len:347 (+),score=79.92 TRINITY_DN16250_c0_g1_i4:188-1228(+)